MKSLNVPLATTLTMRLAKEDFKVYIFYTSLSDVRSSLFCPPEQEKIGFKASFGTS